MTPRKGRLTVTVDPDLIEAGNQAVSAGLADSLSAWVNDALAAKTLQEHRLRSLAAAVAEYEGQFGEITAKEIASQRRTDREAAVVVRGERGRDSRALSQGHGDGAA
jgi:hypothetical protein